MLRKNESHIKGVLSLFDEKKELFTNKNKDYGCSYLKAGKIIDLILEGKEVSLKTQEDHVSYQLLIRKLDKIIRYTTLKFGGGNDSVGEKLSETMGDDGVYGLMLSEFETNCSSDPARPDLWDSYRPTDVSRKV